jgi:hypothetical protein
MQSSSRILLLCSVITLSFSFSGIGFAQSVNDAAKARRDALVEKERAGDAKRQSADQQALDKAALRNRKISVCKAQAKERGLHRFERRRFIKKCAAE